MLTPIDRLKALQARHGLNTAHLSHLLGVPRPTCHHWLTGKRSPPAVAVRLLDVLEMLEVLSPDMLRGLMPVKPCES